MYLLPVKGDTRGFRDRHSTGNLDATQEGPLNQPDAVPPPPAASSPGVRLYRPRGDEGDGTFPERTHWPALGGCLLAILGYTDGIALIARNMNALQNRMLKFEVLEEQA